MHNFLEIFIKRKEDIGNTDKQPIEMRPFGFGEKKKKVTLIITKKTFSVVRENNLL